LPEQPFAPQLQVSMQVPLLQALPALQTTPAQRFFTQVPLAQTSPEAHVTFAHGFAAAQPKLQACPVPQVALHDLRAVHCPVPGSQNCPDAQLTPAHGVAKQPATHAPFTHVAPLLQVTPAQGSVIETHVALHVAPPPQAIPCAVAQGSGWQIPPRQMLPLVQVDAHPPELPPPLDDPPVPLFDEPPVPLFDDPPVPGDPCPAPEPPVPVDEPEPPEPIVA
jgi:hypothetical protein